MSEDAATQGNRIPAVVAVAPLSLDAVAGCGGTLARLASQGARVFYLVVYRSGFPLDRLHRACRLLGIAAGDVACIELDPGTSEERVRARLRSTLTEWAQRVSPALVFLPSLRSADPRDALIARVGFEQFRECTLLCYDRVSRPHNAPRLVVLLLNRTQVHSKLRAMRPRRLRPGGEQFVEHGPAAEVLELAQWRPGLSFPFEEIREVAAAHG